MEKKMNEKLLENQFFRVLLETPIEHALLGMGLSYGKTSNVQAFELFQNEELMKTLLERAKKLAPLDGGHNKFLESMIVTLDIKSTRAFWQEFDTYRVGITKQSESTMHTLSKREMLPSDCSYFVDNAIINVWNNHRKECDDLASLKEKLPEGFLQRRIVVTNYKTLRNMFKQRKNHKYYPWPAFCKELEKNLSFPLFLSC
jgi:hypothetical protein